MASVPIWRMNLQPASYNGIGFKVETQGRAGGPPLWINHLREPITINSPSLVPSNPFTLLLKGVKHLQDSEQGTRTELTLCIPRGLSSTLLVDPNNAVPGT